MLALTAPVTEESHFGHINNSMTDEVDYKNVRSYNELMDVQSLHQFIIRKGKVLDQTPEFISFKRTYISQWGSISYVIHLIEKFLATFGVDMAYVEGKQLV